MFFALLSGFIGFVGPWNSFQSRLFFSPFSHLFFIYNINSCCITVVGLSSAFHDFQFEGSIISHSFGFLGHRHLHFVEECVYCCGNNTALLETKHFSLNNNIYFSNFIIVSQSPLTTLPGSQAQCLMMFLCYFFCSKHLISHENREIFRLA